MIFLEFPGSVRSRVLDDLDESWSTLFVTFRNYCQQLLERTRKKMRAKDHTVQDQKKLSARVCCFLCSGPVLAEMI